MLPDVKRSAPRRVLKSVVGPALGTTLAALLAVVPAACDREETKAKPDPTPTQTAGSSAKVGVSEPTAPEAIDAGYVPPELPDPGKQMPPVGTTTAPHPPVGKPVPPKVGKSIPEPGKVMPKPGIEGPVTVPTVGLRSLDGGDDDDAPEPRPSRGRRRATDPTYRAMIGSGARRLP
jgi:hypothetical protein